MIHLLDLNVLIALCDPAHPSASAFETVDGSATMPLTDCWPLNSDPAIKEV